LTSSSRKLFDFLNQQPREAFEISPRVDARRHLARRFDPELPFLLKLYDFPNYRRMVGPRWMHWHEYFELIVPVSGAGRFQIGDQTIAFTPGDLLIVDNFKLHGVSHLSGPHRSLVIFFPVEAVAAPTNGSPDLAFLAPLFGRPEDASPLLRHDDSATPAVRAALLALAQAWFNDAPRADRFIACKLQLLTILALLRQHFGLRQDFLEALHLRQKRAARLEKVFRWIEEKFPDALTQPQAAAIAGMSASRFRDFFKHTTGSTFVDYLRDVRLARAARLLRETDQSIADIAAATGFSDQSYLHRCFKARYGTAPLGYRKGHRGGARE
jgi:AraC-like DNA-binding protein/mannose-6-phosphate isomerase-like protein (cupin superfamily)